MSTRGAITFVCDGVEKTVYNHSDSYPEWLGVNVLEWLRRPAWDLEVARQAVRDLRMVDENVAPTPEERERYAVYSKHNVSTGDDWHSLLRKTQGEPTAILDAGVAISAEKFPLDSLFCEWAYVVDLDNECLEVYRGFQDNGPVQGRWSAHGPTEGYWPVSLAFSWPLAEVAALGLSSEAHMAAVETAVEEKEQVG